MARHERSFGDTAAGVDDPGVVAQAADWFVRVMPGDDPLAEDGCRRWRAEKPEHERAWQRMLEMHGRLRQGAARLDPHAAAEAVDQRAVREVSRRRTLKWLAGISGAGIVGWGARDVLPWRAWTSQYHTAVGERQTIALEDGTTVLLNTGSAVDVRFSESLRQLVLHSGEILVTTGKDTRPLRVQTRTSRVSPVGTRFTVRNLDRSADRTQVVVFEGSVLLEPSRAGGVPVLVHAGEQAVVGGSTVFDRRPADATAGAWIEGTLAVQSMRLDDFLAELSRYRVGVLRCTPEVAALRMTGVFPLDNTDQALRALEYILPVRVSRRTRYWLTVVPAETENL